MDDIKRRMMQSWTFDYITVQLAVTTLDVLNDRDYGEYGSKLKEKCKNYLFDNGWKAGSEAWKGIPLFLLTEIVNADEFFVPTDFDRIMLAIDILQNSEADDDETELTIQKFRKCFNFFNLTYHQQMELLKIKLKEKPIFDEVSFSRATMLYLYIFDASFSGRRASSTLDPKVFPDQISLFKYVPHTTFPESLFSVIGHTVIQPVRFSFSFPKAYRDRGSWTVYARKFAYCGRPWRCSLSHFSKTDTSILLELERLSRPDQPSNRYSSLEEIPYISQNTDDNGVSTTSLSKGSFELKPEYLDWRESVNVYYMHWWTSNDELNEKKVYCSQELKKIDDRLIVGWYIPIPSYVNESASRSFEMTLMMGVI
ncbi:unnamed protein product [Ambrosiozyma monospora]|uniref:Unnamed protein product n=1 Tax=Ambrosiozyma monospora TaxID=43982 RepID=A0ACB5TB84_AMBMO|nr:unnamed protein product [Ambrosiozyma monospora]